MLCQSGPKVGANPSHSRAGWRAQRLCAMHSVAGASPRFFPLAPLPWVSRRRVTCLLRQGHVAAPVRPHAASRPGECSAPRDSWRGARILLLSASHGPDSPVQTVPVRRPALGPPRRFEVSTWTSRASDILGGRHIKRAGGWRRFAGSCRRGSERIPRGRFPGCFLFSKWA